MKARERYEAKTKVISFRVPLDAFDQIEEVKTETGVSYTDLIKLGAGIAQEEIKAKLAEVSGLGGKLAELKTSVEEEQQGLSEFVAEEKRRRLEGLNTELEAFKLFDRRWRVEEVACKLGIPQAVAGRYFDEWGKERKDKRATQRELLRRCLKKHIESLKERRLWVGLRPGSTEEDLEALERQIDDCRRLLSHPSKISKVDREFLIAEYSSKV
jgi:hypothetical protein